MRSVSFSTHETAGGHIHMCDASSDYFTDSVGLKQLMDDVWILQWFCFDDVMRIDTCSKIVFRYG